MTSPSLAHPPSESLRAIEDMLHEIGGAAPTIVTTNNQAAHRAQHAANKGRGSPASPQQKDCLAKENRVSQGPPKVVSRDQSSPSLSRGAPMAGKDRAEKRYLGRGFTMPPRESPGPIYEVSNLTVGNSQDGSSFSKAQRLPPSQYNTCSPGPVYGTTSCIGRQIHSASPTAGSAPFTRSKRFNPKEFVSRAHSKSVTSQDSPGPTAYQSDIMNLTDKGLGVSFSDVSRDKMKKVWISRGHFADNIGVDSPGPIYNINDGDGPVSKTRPNGMFNSVESKYRKSPAFSLGITDRQDFTADELLPEITDATGTCTVENIDGKWKRRCVHASAKPQGVCRHIKQQKFITSEHSKVQNTSETPGPAYYYPTIGGTRKNSIGVSFTRDKGVDLSRRQGCESPGPVYNTNDSYTRPSAPSVAIGSGDQSTDARRERFDDKVFLGKGIGETRGRYQSPGPVYDQETKLDKAPAYTMVFKEKHFPKTIYPGPSRIRYISKDLQKDDLGAYSPGPKYNIGTKEFGAEAKAVSFGVSDRYFDREKFSDDQLAKFGTAEKPYTSPYGARYISQAHNKAAACNMSSPGPQNPKVTPKDDYCSTNKTAPKVGIAPAPQNKSRVLPPENDKNAPLTYPKDDVTHGEQQVHKFPKAERMPALKPYAGPSPGQYVVRFDLVEKRVKGSHFGGV